MDSTHPTGTHGPHCTRCGVEDDSIVLDSEGGPDLCASCASDRPPPSPDRAVGPTLPDSPVAGRAALVSGLDPDPDDDYPGEEDDSAVWRCASCGCSCGEHSCCHRPNDEQAPASTPSSLGAGAAASPAGSPLPLGSVGGAALDGARCSHPGRIHGDDDAPIERGEP